MTQIQTILHFTTEIPDYGGSVRVKDTADEIARKLRAAQLHDYPTIEVTTANNRPMIVPVHLIGPAVEITG